MNAAATKADQPKPFALPLMRSLAGYRASAIAPDLIAGVTLAAIAIPEQMATARLGGLPPQAGFFAFIAAAVAFFVFGASRKMSVGADSTIAPIFAGALAILAVGGAGGGYAADAALLAGMVGVFVAAAGLARMGWIASLLSTPVTNGFLTGIAVHIVASQAPSALGVAAAKGPLPLQLAALAQALPHANPYAVAIAAGVLALTAVAHIVSPRIPGALIAMALAAWAVAAFGLAPRGVDVLGAVPAGLPALALPPVSIGRLVALTPLALIISLVCMVQTGATDRSFPSVAGEAPDIDGDFVGLGAANLAAGLFGGFPVNASPPRTGVVSESGGRSQFAGVFAAAVLVLLLTFGTNLLGDVPRAALSGVLLFVAARIVRVREMRRVLFASPLEFALLLATAAAIVVLPIEQGAAVGIALSLIHGMWSSVQPRAFEMHRIPGTTIWWPTTAHHKGERLEGVAVVGFQAPLTFFNAESFRRVLLEQLSAARPVKLLVLEAAGVIDIDFTAAEAVRAIAARCQEQGVTLAVARLEAVDARHAFQRLGLAALIGDDRVFDSVDEAVRTLAPGAKPMPS